MTACVFPGSYIARYDVCLILPEFKYPEYRMAVIKQTPGYIHRVSIQPDWLGIRSAMI